MAPTPQAWQRLAELLRQQRARVDANAARFAEINGLNYRLVYDIEHARRSNYRADTLTRIESAYRLRRNAITDFLEGRTESLEDGADPLPAPQSTAEEQWDGYLAGEPHLAPGEVLRWQRLAPRDGHGRIRYVMTYADPESGESAEVDHVFSDERTIDFAVQYFREIGRAYAGDAPADARVNDAC